MNVREHGQARFAPGGWAALFHFFLVEFMGMVGAVVAVPVAAAAQIVIAEIVTIRREQARQHGPQYPPVEAAGSAPRARS